MSLFQLVAAGDLVSRLVAVALLLMSIASWVVIVWKSWLLHRCTRDVARATLAFWQASDLDDGARKLAAFDRDAMLQPMLLAVRSEASGTLAGAGDRALQLTRVLRDALRGARQRLQFGQVLLATVGATAPFVGLLGTVWGIYHALIGIASAGQVSIDKISGPVGEALLMTAAGLVVAIPAVLGYNMLGRAIARVEADLDGFARDLRELVLSGQSKS
jgi:biopolymer transport protein ExbB